MGRFVNPDNSAFQAALNSRIYVDKTGLIACMNEVLDSTDAYICNSRQGVLENPIQRICLQRIIAKEHLQKRCFLT